MIIATSSEPTVEDFDSAPRSQLESVESGVHELKFDFLNVTWEAHPESIIHFSEGVHEENQDFSAV